MKKIIIIISVIFSLFVVLNTTYSSYRDYDDGYYESSNNRLCDAWRYGPYSFPRISDWRTYTASSWDRIAVLECNNWYISVKTSRNNSYNNNHYSNISDWSCSSWRYGSHTFPRFSDNETYTSVVWNTTAILVCKNWYVSIQSSNTIQSTVYSNPSNGSCNAWRYVSHSFPALDNGQTYKSKKYIGSGYVTTTLICKNWYVSIFNSVTSCNSWYESYWKNCNARETYNKTCYAWNYGWYNHPNIRHNKTYTVKKRLNRWYVYKVLKCNNWRITLRNTYGWLFKYWSSNRGYGYWNNYDYWRYDDFWFKISIPFFHF